MTKIGLGERVIWWLGLNFGLALTPLAVNAFTGETLGWSAAIAHGELILIACGTCGLAVATASTVETERRRLREAKAAISVSGLIFLLASGLVYAGIYRQAAIGKADDVIWQSYVLAAAALLIGVLSIVLDSRAADAA